MNQKIEGPALAAEVAEHREHLRYELCTVWARLHKIHELNAGDVSQEDAELWAMIATHPLVQEVLDGTVTANGR